MANFTVAPSAETDLNEVWRYIADDNEAAAEKFIYQLSGKFQMLAENKELGTRQDNYIVEMRRFPFKNYHIYYFPTAEGVEIYRVLHSRRDIEGLFEEYFDDLES